MNKMKKFIVYYRENGKNEKEHWNNDILTTKKDILVYFDLYMNLKGKKYDRILSIKEI